MKVGKDRRIIFGAVIEISHFSRSHWNQKTNRTFSSSLVQDPCHPGKQWSFMMLDQKMVKYTNLMSRDKVMGTFLWENFFMII